MSAGSGERRPAGPAFGPTVRGCRVAYGDARLPEDFPARLARLKELSGLSWNSLADLLGVDSRQLRRWRRGIEPCGGAMRSIVWVSAQIPGGIDAVMGEGFSSIAAGPER